MRNKPVHSVPPRTVLQFLPVIYTDFSYDGLYSVNWKILFLHKFIFGHVVSTTIESKLRYHFPKISSKSNS